ncbi:hypothetical protein [Listeria seeligeri]|uniref:hypothetical protein n=1 Tax=Listeria seeligeri TaxID=1640 RepID=UPI0031CC894F
MAEFPIVFDTWFMFIYLLIIIGAFFVTLVLAFEKYKFSLAGKALLGLCFLSLGVLIVYVILSGYASDVSDLIFNNIGILEVLLFTHPYIFLILAILLGGEKKPKWKSKTQKN